MPVALATRDSDNRQVYLRLGVGNRLERTHDVSEAELWEDEQALSAWLGTLGGALDGRRLEPVAVHLDLDRAVTRETLERETKAPSNTTARKPPTRPGTGRKPDPTQARLLPATQEVNA